MMDTIDDNVLEAAVTALARSSVGELRQVRVDRSENQIELSGHVRSYYHKQLAQEAVRPVTVGMQLINRVAVGL